MKVCPVQVYRIEELGATIYAPDKQHESIRGELVVAVGDNFPVLVGEKGPTYSWPDTGKHDEWYS